MKKRVLSLLLVLLMVMSLVPISALADKSSTYVAYAVEGGNIYFNKTRGIITDCDQSVTEVIIPTEIDGVAVTSIDHYAFYQCTSLASVTISNSVTSIGVDAFYACQSLASVNISNSVTSIAAGAFSDCTSLANVAIPNSVTSISHSVFEGCTSLANIDIPDSVTSIDSSAFQGCTSLVSIDIPNGVGWIGASVFQDCTSLASVYIPNSVTWIGNYAFAGCTSLEGINIPDKVSGIDSSAFSLCTALTTVYLPTSVKTIGNGAFRYCTSISDVYYAGDAAQWNAIKIEPYNEPLTGATIHYGGTAHTHSYTAAVTVPTCTEQGYTTYTCSCGDSYKSDYKDALGHDYQNGTCTRCGAKDPSVTPPHTHDYKAVVTAPTCTQAGYTTYTCSCGDSYKSDYKDALGHDYQNGTCTRCGQKDPNYKPQSNLTDVAAGSYCYDAVQWAVANGITNGTDATHFSPNAGCTRGQVVTFLWRAAGEPTVSGNVGFVDVAPGSYCYEAVKWAVANGITKGTDATHFSPNATCTRGQVVTFMYRAAGEPAVGGSNGFVDVAAGSYCYNAVQWAVANGITKGTDATHFSPNATCTRGQVVTFLYRAQ